MELSMTIPLLLLVVASLQISVNPIKPESKASQATGKNLVELAARANEGNAEAMYELGTSYEAGGPLPANGAEAVRWIRKAALLGNTPAMREMGVLAGRGDGVPQSYREELRWYKLAADKGDDVAMLYAGYMYALGDGVPQDFAEALRWYRMAGDRGQSRALLALGEMYRDGKGVRRDFETAYFWLNLSSADPILDSRKERDAVAARLSYAQQTEVQKKCGLWLESHPGIHE